MLWGGLNTATGDPRGLAPGETPDAQNWITGRNQDHIELRRGKFLLGSTRRNVSGAHVTGLGIGVTNIGQQVPFFTYAEKLLYYNSSTDDTQEVDTVNLLGPAANGEDVVILSYQNLAGAFTYVLSAHSSIYKIATCYPGSVSDQGNDLSVPVNSYGEVQDFHFGFARIDDSRMYGMNRYGRSQGSQDQTGLYVSHLDRQELGDFGNRMASPPPTPVLTQATTGGSITANTYYFVITMFGPEGVETLQGVQVSIVVPSSTTTNTITLTFPNIAGATRYNIYGSTTSGSYTDPSLIATIFAAPPGAGNNVYTLTDFSPIAGNPPSSTTQLETDDLGTGDGTTKTFSGGSLGGYVNPSTAFAIVVTDGNEYFTDNKLGVLTGTLGGTGTINYITGAYSVTFNTAPINGARVTIAFYLEDATTGGIIDFVPNFAVDGNGDLVDPGTAQTLRQDDGGGVAQAVFPFNGVEYAFHVLRSWQTQVDDFSPASNGGPTIANNTYFEQIGIPYPRAAFPTGTGVIFLDNSKPTQPEVKVLTIPPGSTNLTVVPVSLSLDQLDLSGYAFDQCVVFQWDEYNIVCCKNFTNGMESTYNNVVFMQNINSGKWDRLNYTISCLADFVGTLLGGDSLSANVFELFSGFDDDQNTIANYYNTSPQDLEIDGLKTVGYIHMRGLIQNSQKLNVSYSLDGSNYTYLFTINGNGSYVNQGSPVTIGSRMVGSNVVGGGNGSGPLSDIVANEYELDIPIQSDLFEYISLQFQATAIGYVSVDNAGYKDIRWKRRRLLMTEDIQVDF
ncbi:unnamed protein product [Sphagnum balticum]